MHLGHAIHPHFSGQSVSSETVVLTRSVLLRHFAGRSRRRHEAMFLGRMHGRLAQHIFRGAARDQNQGDCTRETAMRAASAALCFTSAMLAARLRPSVIRFRYDKRKGVTAFPTMLSLRASSMALSIRFLISVKGISS